MTVEAKTAIALVFEGLGGVDGMIEWARENNKNMSAFYCRLYSRLIPLQLGADDVAARVEDDAEDARSALERAFRRLIDQRHEQGEVAPVAIDGGAESEPVTPQQNAPPLEHTPLKKSA